MNFADNASGIAVPIITGLILQPIGACLTVLFFAGCAALSFVGSLLIDFRQAEAR